MYRLKLSERKTILVEKLGEITMRCAMGIKSKGVLYKDGTGEITARDKSEFERMFERIR